MVDLDLDVLSGRTRTVKIRGEILTVYTPELNSLVQILKTSQELQTINDSTDSKVVLDGFESLIDLIEVCVPGIKKKDPSIEQLTALIEMIMALATPTDVEELSKNGIKLDSENVKKNQT